MIHLRLNRLVLAASMLVAVACAAPTPTREPTPAPDTPAPSPSGPTASPSASLDSTGLPSPAISIATGLSPRLAPEEVADQVVARIHAMEREAGYVATPPRIIAIRATSGPGGIQWRVDAEGTFTSHRPRVSPPPVATAGYFIFSDTDGGIIGFGFR